MHNIFGTALLRCYHKKYDDSNTPEFIHESTKSNLRNLPLKFSETQSSSLSLPLFSDEYVNMSILFAIN